MEQPERLVDKSQQPTTGSVTAFIGPDAAARWAALLGHIESAYPGVFSGEWLYGGAKHGWALRLKRSRPLCTLIPERDRMRVVIVFGAAEREQVQHLLPELISHVRDDYARATTYRDGRWVVVDVDSDEVLHDVERLLHLKRRPRAHP